ncbi:MAG: tetratricopeptide repeat-containing sensor histidine kinase [Cyclobacteriaceae bacterium]|jgi:signal transduction histidine kinase|nr:tetratricopeptide repeat-containing sensor histidine kinase [Cyclobacteriaceae bacterium]
MFKRILFGILILFSGSFKSLSQQFIPEEDLKKVYTYRLNNRNDSALFLLNKISQKFAATNVESGYVYTEMGNIYYQLALDKIALKLYTRAIGVFEKTNDLLGKSIALSNCATVLERTAQSDSTQILFTEALTIQQSLADSAYIAYTLRGLALYELRKKNTVKAQTYFKQALRFYNSDNIKLHKRYAWDVQFIPQQIFLAGFEVYKTTGQADSALHYMQLALQTSKEFGIAQHQVRYKTFLANYLSELKKFTEAEIQLTEALALAKKHNYQWGEFGVLQAYRNFYKAQRDTVKTAQASLRFYEFKDKVFNNKNNDELLVMSNLVLQYENELEIRQQKNVIKEKDEVNALQKKFNQTLLVGLILVAVVLIFTLYLYRSLRKSNTRISGYVKEVETHNETMRMLLSVISHDVRAPFRSLLGLTKITMMEKELPAEEVQLRVAMMHDTAAKGSVLLDNLLQWVALQRDKVLIEKSPVNTSEILDEVTQELANLSLTENVKIERQIFTDTMFTDRNGFKMIVRNLLTNAIRYSAGKKVVVGLKEIDKFVYLHVTDSGPGIPDELLQSLFAKGDMKKVAAKGGGLGLQIVKEMVQQLGGDIRAINLPEGGARFEVRLPN